MSGQRLAGAGRRLVLLALAAMAGLSVLLMHTQVADALAPGRLPSGTHALVPAGPAPEARGAPVDLPDAPRMPSMPPMPGHGVHSGGMCVAVLGAGGAAPPPPAVELAAQRQGPAALTGGHRCSPAPPRGPPRRSALSLRDLCLLRV